MENLPKTLVSDETRAASAKLEDLGAGNFLAEALRISPAPNEPILFLEKPLRSAGGVTQLSLNDLGRLAASYAAFYDQRGVGRQDSVMIYLDDGVEYLLHYLALVHVGAIGVLTNGNMAPEIAAAHARNTNCVAVITDESHVGQLSAHLSGSELRLFVTEESIQLPDPGLAPNHYRHAADDPIMIAHSSGTTGIPKAVLLQHKPFFHGVRYRLALPRVPGGERILSSLPHSHNCAIAYIMLAMLAGTPVYVASDHTGLGVLRQIEHFKPSMVVSFPQTYVEITEQDMSAFDLSSVSLWFNGGDAAHEAHIRRLIAHGSHLFEGQRRKGSIFIDGMGSSEMGFSLFRHAHTPATNHYNRCVGRPLEWVQAAILSEEGEVLPPRVVGRFGVKAPSVTSGYWNNTQLTYRSRLAGYFLTGDLGYTDEEGRFYHVDRTPDRITTARGPVYGLQTEELLLARFAALADCTVFGVGKEGSQRATVFVRVRPGSELEGLRTDELLARFNSALSAAKQGLLDAVFTATQADIPLGTTGKVLKRQLRALALDLETNRRLEAHA
jgi:acyl-coenzyme A synthetase/AMP-(fatty) acid ligase